MEFWRIIVWFLRQKSLIELWICVLEIARSKNQWPFLVCPTCLGRIIKLVLFCLALERPSLPIKRHLRTPRFVSFFFELFGLAATFPFKVRFSHQKTVKKIAEHVVLNCLSCVVSSNLLFIAIRSNFLRHSGWQFCRINNIAHASLCSNRWSSFVCDYLSVKVSLS